MKSFFWLMSTELKLLTRQGNTFIQPLLLFYLITLLFHFSLSSIASEQLRTLAPSIIWIAALLAVLMELNQLFNEDYRDGTLEQIILSQSSILGFIHAKIITYWLRNGLLISLFSPIVALTLGLGVAASFSLFTALILGTFVLSYLGGLIASLLLASKKNGLTMALLALPFYIPVIIIGSVMSFETGALISAHSASYFMLALLVFCLTLCPLAIRYGLEYGVQ